MTNPYGSGLFQPPQFSGSGGLLGQPGAPLDPNTPWPPQGGGLFTPPQFAGSGGLLGQPGAPTMPNTPFGVAPTGIGGTADSQWQADQAALAAQQQLIGGREALLGLQPQALTARSNVLNAQQAQQGAQAAYLAEQTRANMARLAEQQAIQAAQGNTQDILSVARAQNQRNSQSYIYRLGGMAAPVEVTLPPGYNGPMPPGVVARLQTLAEQLADASKDKEVMRKFNEEAARIATARIGLEVDAAQIASGRVNLLLDEAEMAVQRMGLTVDRAQLAQRASRLPPAPGLDWDEESQQWLSFAQIRERNRERGRTERELAEQEERGRYPGLEGLSLDTLMSMMTEAAQGTGAPISEEQFRSALASPPHSRSAAQIDALLALARARAVSTRQSSGDIDPALLEALR